MCKHFLCSLFLAAFSLNALAQETTTINGDVNHDGKVDISDVVAVINIIAGKDNSQQEVKRLLSFTVTQDKFVNPAQGDDSGELDESDPELNAKRRLPVATNANLSEFYYSAVYNSVNYYDVPKSVTEIVGNKWESEYSWPEDADDDEVVDFYAYANLDAETDDVFAINDYGRPYINFVTDETVTELKDFIVAKASDSYSNSQGQISLRFWHACGALKFYISKTDKLSNYTVKVQKMVLHNIPCSGEYYPNENIWFVYRDKPEDFKEFTVNAGEPDDAVEVGTEQTLIGKTDDYLFLLPQTLTPWDKGATLKDAYVEIVCKIYDENNNYKVGTAADWGWAYLPLNLTIQQGYITPVHISMGTALRDGGGNKLF